MSEFNRFRITKYRKNILSDIQEDVIEELQKLDVLTKLDMQQLDNTDNFKEKMELFLDIVLGKSLSDLQHFIRCLQVWYDWLYDLIMIPNNDIYSLAPLSDDLIRGGVPPLPHRNVSRSSLVNIVREQLMDLNRNQYLVLHGMLGSGKTSLATEAVNCEMIRKICDGHIFWISVGSEGEKNIQTLQESLNSLLPEPVLNLTDDIDVALIRLKIRFSDWEVGKNALIILDDVHSEKVVNYLCVGTKFLITTEDANIIGGNRKSVTIFQKVPDGFDEEETLSLLASSIAIKPHELPSQAKFIHKLSKGHPLIVSLISAQLEDHKEQVLADSSRWDYYVKLFSDKKLKRRSLDENGYLNNAIKISIASMEKKRIKYFEHFAIFAEDVNIKPEVLAIMWSMDKHDVENLTMEFLRKSLIVRKWNVRFKSYVYGIHDLILRYLTNNLNKNDIVALHRNFIESYMKTCEGGDLSKLKIEDNYIYYYIGRHLQLANMFHLFPILYFNLEFIEMKLKKAGPADVIMDFKRYRNLIVGSGESDEIRNTEKLNCFIGFVELYGYWINKGLDIAQLALQVKSSSYIYKCGLELIKKRRHRSYVSFPYGPHPKDHIVPQMVYVKKHISTICLTSSQQFVLVGSEEGNIELWDLRSKVIRKLYNEHSGYITKLKLDSSSNNFLSASLDSTVRVWALVIDGLSGDRTPSPREVQDSYSELWPTSKDKLGEKSLTNLAHSTAVIWACFPQLSNSKIIATVSHPNFVNVWYKYELKWSIERDGAKSCELCNQDQWVVVACAEKMYFYSVNTSIMLNYFAWKANYLCSIPEIFGGGLLIVSDDRVDVWGPFEHKPTIVHSEIGIDEKYSCCAVNYHIALGTNKNNVRVCDRRTGKTLAKFSESRTGAKLIDISFTEGALVTAFNDKTLFLWPLDDIVLPMSSSICWPYAADAPYICRVHGNYVQFLNGRDIVGEFSIDREIVSLALSPDAQLIAYTHSQNKVIHIIKGNDHQEIWKCDMNFNYAMKKFYVFNVEQKAIVVAHSEQSVVHVWIQETNQLIKLGDESTKTKFVTLISNDNLQLITASAVFGVNIWDLRTGKIIRTLTHFSVRLPQLFSISFNKGRIALAESKMILIIDTENGDILAELREPVPVMYCTLSPNGKILAYALRNDLLVVYDIETKDKKNYTFDVKRRDIELTMAVSDSGILCVATADPVVMVYTKLGVSNIVLLVSSIVPSPDCPDKFAVVDNYGDLHILQISDKNDIS